MFYNLGFVWRHSKSTFWHRLVFNYLAAAAAAAAPEIKIGDVSIHFPSQQHFQVNNQKADLQE
jgi:hypothetical protein